MMPTDIEPTNFSDDPGDQQMISPSFKQIQVDSGTSGFDATATDTRSVPKQYIIVGFVLAVSAALLWYMRDQGLGVGFASGTEVKIDYELDANAANTDTEHQRELLFNLELTDNPNQVPVEDLKKNPFEMAILVQGDEPEEVATTTSDPIIQKGPTAEEIRARDLQRTVDGLKLNTVLRGRVSLARIDGKTYRVGDVVESEFLVLSIDDRSVTLGADGKTYVIELVSK
jgi:hypothetical protein